jgi:hypothetical protein
MEQIEGLLGKFTLGVQYPDVSGFELLELLDIRSKIAEQESNLSEEEKRSLEAADRCFLKNVGQIHAGITQVADLMEVRKNTEASPSHWWWYLEELVGVEKVAA